MLYEFPLQQQSIVRLVATIIVQMAESVFPAQDVRPSNSCHTDDLQLQLLDETPLDFYRKKSDLNKIIVA